MRSQISAVSSSKASIISKDILKQLNDEEIKQSTVKPKERQVQQWTPVVIGTSFPIKVNKLKVEYIGGDLLNKQDFPKQLKKVAGGLIIDLPLVGIKDTLSQMISIENLQDDESMIKYLEDWLREQHNKKNKNVQPQLTAQMLMELPLF